MTLCLNNHPLLALLETEECDQILGYKLRADGLADQRRELARAHREVLFDLHDAQLVTLPLCLDRQDILGTTTIQADVHLIRFYLTNTGHLRAQVALE